MKYKLLILILFITLSILYSQTRTDPREMALCGAYAVESRGLFSVGYNPANLAIRQEKDRIRIIGGFALNINNNFLTIYRYRKYNGQDFEANNGALKKSFLASLPSSGWRIFAGFHLPIPLVNYSSGNKAFTYDLLFITDIGIAKDLIRVLIDSNPINEKLDLTLKEEAIGIGQWAFSFGIPFENFNIGFSFKYLQGLIYMGFNPDSSYGYLITYFTDEKNYIEGEGYYLFQQTIGGMGYSFDFGVTTKLINGYRFGLSIINLFGRIYWNKRVLLNSLLDTDEILLMDGNYYKYEFKINEARFGKFFRGVSYDEVFSGRGTEFKDTTKFVMRYPGLFRIGFSKRFNDVVICSDIIAGFEDRLYSFGKWKWAIGFEILRAINRPVRIGFGIGGKEMREVAIGSGFYGGLINIDWAIGFCNSIVIRKMQGIKFSIMVYTRR